MTELQQHYNWIMGIIDSCRHDFHFEGVDRLIELFNARHQHDALHTSLLQLRAARWNSIHSILK